MKILKIRLHEAEQDVLFEGEGVGGTCKEGVVGWGCSRCRSQRLKLAKFLFGRNLRKPVCDYLNNQLIASLQNRRGDRGDASEVVAEVSRGIDLNWRSWSDFSFGEFWCGLARWPKKGGKTRSDA